MAIIALDDVRGFQFDQNIFCVDCVTDAEKEELVEEEIITCGDVENTDDYFFCDRCGQRI